VPYQPTEIEGVFLFTPKVFEDSRGYFLESFRQDKTLEETGFNFEVKQVNTSLSKRGVLRDIGRESCRESV
jgi:dTDP-4-dehydrorhamnose 3,5-epimerase-like enzyme